MGNGFGKFRRNNLLAKFKKHGASEAEIEAVRSQLDKDCIANRPRHKHLKRKLMKQLVEEQCTK